MEVKVIELEDTKLRADLSDFYQINNFCKGNSSGQKFIDESHHLIISVLISLSLYKFIYLESDGDFVDV